MNFIKKLFSKKKMEKFDPEKVNDKPIGPLPINKPENPFNPIPVPKDPTIKDR